MNGEDPIEPSGIGQFVEHNRCLRYLKQRVNPGEEPDARDWREAFDLMNVALLGKGQEFEAKQVERLSADADRIIAPELNVRTKAGVPNIPVDETWADSPRGRAEQLAAAVEHAATLDTTTDDTSYLLLYQVPLTGILGEESVYGDADCIALAPADAVATSDTTEPAVVARVIDCKSAQDEQPAHRVQVAAYSMLLEQTLAKGACEFDCRIEASVLTQTHATDDDSQPPFELPTFQRSQWELYVTRLLDDTGPVAETLGDDLQELPFTLDQVCNNCAYREACATRAVENSRGPQSLALLGLDTSTQRSLREAGLTSLYDVATLAPPHRETTPMDDPPQLDIDADLRRTLEETPAMPIHELIIRAQALFSGIEPNYPDYWTPPAIPGNDWVPLPDDRCDGWSNIQQATPGELIHVALFVRPDSAINRVGVLGASVTADEYDETLTIGEVIEAVPDETEHAATMERRLLDRFTTQLFNAIEQVATALGDPETSVVHCYTYSDHELDTLTEALERHDDLEQARAMRALCSLDEDGHTDADQSMVTAVQPVVHEHFALQSASQGLLSVVDQFVPDWTRDSFDPPDVRPNVPPLREIFGEQFLSDAVPYLRDEAGLRLHLARGPLAEGPTADAVDVDDPDPDPDGWYRIRKRSGSQFPLEYLWAAVPKQLGDDVPRLHPDVVPEWAVDDEDEALYRQEIERFYYRTGAGDERLQPEDVAYLAERLSDSLQRLIGAIPYKDAYHPKEPLDATQLDSFGLSAATLTEAARDYLGMEFGAAKEATIDQYRASLRERARSGRSMPVRCTDYMLTDDGTLTIVAELAYDELFSDPATAQQVAQQARLRGSDGTSGGSWRVVTRLTDTSSETSPGKKAPAGRLESTVDDPKDTQHSPPVFVDDLDLEAGEIVLTALSHRFRRHGSRFRVDHCGWVCPDGTNLADSDTPVADCDDYIAGRQPVWADTGELYMLDPMVDNFGAPKTARALQDTTIKHNPLWDYLQAASGTGDYPQPSSGNDHETADTDDTDADADAGSEESGNLGEAKDGRAVEDIETIEHFLDFEAHLGSEISDDIDGLEIEASGELDDDDTEDNKTEDGTDIADSDQIDVFCDQMAASDACLTPNEAQRQFIEAVDRPLVPLQGPPGTGKTSGATAPALLARAYARVQQDRSFTGFVIAPSHEAVDAALDGVVACLDNWRATTSGLSDLELLRVTPTPAPGERADADAMRVSVTYAAYHTDAGTATIEEAGDTMTDTEPPTQQLIFATPATLYNLLGIVAETCPAIDGESAPAAMRYAPGLADVVCLDEASMLDLPRLFLATSALKTSGQTLLVGDHRQLATISEVDWTATRRRPVAETGAYQSALEYIQQLVAEQDTCNPDQPTTDGCHQSVLSQFSNAADDPGGAQ